MKKDQIDYTEFLKNVRESVSSQYDEDKDFWDILLEEPEEEERPPAINPNSFVNVSNMRNDRIKESIMKVANVLIGPFVLKMERGFMGEIIHLSLFQKGDNNMHQPINWKTDIRFKEAEIGEKQNMEMAIQLVRYLQMMHRCSLFI